MTPLKVICATETLFEQTVTTIAQVMNSVSYQRRTNALSALYNDAKKAKNTLHEQKELVECDESNLFGETFKEFLKDHVKAKKKAK